MTNKPVAIVLGGTVPHITLINKLKKRGYYTVLIDYLDNPPAKEYADQHIKESTLDKDKVLEIARMLKAAIVISTCVDQANSVCCYVGEKLGLPHPYSYQTSLDVTDKCRMKEIMLKHNIPTSNYVYASDVKAVVNKSLKYPLIIKPADSNSSNGVKKVFNETELKKYFPVALKFSRNGYVIVEEFVEGVEIGAYYVIVNKKAHLLMMHERYSTIEGSESTIKCYACYAPAKVSPAAVINSEKIANSISNAFNLDNTPLFFQGIVNGDNVNVIEFAPRVGGGISSKTIKYSTGFDIIDAAIDSFLSIPISLSNWHHMNKIFVVNQIYGSSGIYDHTVGTEELLKKGIIDNISFYKMGGTYINDATASGGRIGVMLFSANTESDIYHKIKIAFDSIDCYDKSGNSMIRRDLNLFVHKMCHN